MKTISPSQMKKLENDYMKRTGVPGILLMEQAAIAVCNAVKKYSAYGRVLFVAGPGNNGGDGYAAARIWQQHGGKPEIWEMTSSASGDAAVNRRLALECGIGITTLHSTVSDVPDVDAVVDALFGTGLSRQLDGIAAELVNILNTSGKPIVSVDIPSGLDGETGKAGKCIRAAQTVTFHRIKTGLLLRDGPEYTGKIAVAPILIPYDDGNVPGLNYMTAEELSSLIPKRKATSHKGSYGHSVIFAGSMGMCGAASFCASACVKAGSGLTTILCRQSIAAILQTLCPEAMCVPLPEENGKILPCAEQIATEQLRRADSACVGCGLGTDDSLLHVLSAFADCQCPTVWDADGLNILSQNEKMLLRVKNKWNNFFTPHPGEAARLLKCNVSSVTENPVQLLEKLQNETGGVVLLKGARSLMTDGTDRAINIYGTPALGKGGSGDVLSGILTALLAMKLPNVSPLQVMQLAVMIHSMAGMRCAEQDGENCLTPGQLVSYIRLDSAGIS